MKRAVFGVILFLYFLPAIGQESRPVINRRQPYLQLNFLTGSFWSRSIYLDEQFEKPYKAIEARFGYQLTGNKPWHQIHRYPKLGFGMHYSDLVKNPSDTVVGNPLSLFGFYSSPWARFGRFTLASDLGVGLSYTNRTHNFELNPYNDVIASHVNLYFHLDLNLNIKVTPRVGIDLGYGLTHYSNGRIHMPQKGVNNWGWSFGMNWLLKEPVKDFIYREAPEFKTDEALQLMYAIGVVEAIPSGSSTELRFFTSSFTADYQYQFSPKGAVAFGLDVLYDGSLERSVKGWTPAEVSTFQQMYLASHMGYHIIVDRITILLNFGTYYWQSSRDRGFWFIRAGGRYRFTDHFYGHISIKSKNGIRSDWIEWGAVYQINLRRKNNS